MFRLITLLVAVLSLNLLPAWSHAFTLASDLSRSLGESRRVASLALSKSRNGQPAFTEMSRLTVLRDELAALRLLHAEYGSSVASRASSLGGKAADRQQALTTSLSPELDDLIVKLDAAIKSGSAEDLQHLLDTINRLLPSRPRPLLGTLPYKHPGYPPREPATSPLVAPAYKGGDRTVHPADTAASAEATLTREIVELAQSLQWNPVLIYEWVKNNVETEWYWGSMKGAGETLRQKSGNDADQASLLVALLRAANFPARYVRGTIDFFPSIEHAKNLTGLDDPIRIADFLRKAGIPFKPVISGGGIANFQIEHIWVETFIPYANYRGAVLDEQGKLWLGLDTSIKPRGYSRGQGGGVPADLLATLRDDYLKGIRTLTPLEYLAAKLDEQLAESQPGKSWSDLRDTAVLIPDVLKIIPDSMQFNQIAITGEYQTLPEELKHKLTITATAGGNELFSITQDTHKLSNRRLALRAEPETVEDQNTIDSFGGLDNTPAYLVRLRPVLTLDGEQLIVAQDGLPMGGDFTLNTDIITPNGTERISSSQVNGNLSVIGVVAQLSTKSTNDTKIVDTDDAETILHKEAISYIDSWNRSEDDLAALLGQRITRPTVTIVTVGGQIEVAYLLDSPQDFQWKGLYLDAGYRRIETTGRNGLESDFMRLSSLQGSILENRIFEDDLKVDSVSTAKLLQLASAGGTPVIVIDKTGIDAILPTLAFDEAVKADIVNAVNQGLTVTIPQTEIAYQDWSGIGYVKENPVTGEAGWMLSGQVAGGMTAAISWANDYLMSVMYYYNSVPTTEPPSRMLKVSATDQQSGTVGKDLPQKLAVMVLDKYGRPVRDANVTFSVTAGGGTVTTPQPVRSLPNGIAAVDFTPGKKTGDNPVYSKLTPLDQELTRVGGNIVSATLETPAGNMELKNPFEVYGLPDVPTRIVKTFGDNTRTLVNNPAGSLQVMVVDQYENPVSNVVLRYKADPPQIALQPSPPISLPSGTRNISLYLPKSCSNPYPIFGECASTDTVELKTAYDGCFVNAILGDTVNTRYTVQVSAPSLSDVPTENFSLFSQGNRPDGRYLPPSLVVRYLESYTSEGQPINAAALGKPLEAPLTAELLLITDEYSTEGPHTCTRNIQDIAETYDCWRIVPSGKSLVTKVTSAALAFKVSSGEGSVSSTTDLLNGKYQATFTAGPNPQKNTVGASGSALVTVPEVFYDSDKQMAVMDGYRSGILRQRSVNLATNKQVLFDRFRVDPDPIPVLGDTEKLSDLIIFSVKATLSPLPPIWVDQNYIAEQDVRLELKVEPAEYRAGLSQIVQNLNGKPYSYYPANQSGSDSVVLLKNSFSFNPKDSHDFQAELNSGSPVEIRSNQVPLQIVGGHVEVQRTHILSQFDPVVPPGVGTSYLDSYKPLPIRVDTPATVRVAILDNNRLETATLVPSTSLGAGDYDFVIDYQQVRDSGFDPAVNPEFFILVEKSFGDPPILHTSLHSGRISDRTEGKMLGQTIVHDVMIQDGSLNLSRQDMAFTGRGPQLAFSRSYNNQSSPRGFTPLGNGWSHSLDMKLRPISSSVSGPGGLPTWVVDSHGSIVPESAIPTTLPGWTMVQVNGAVLKKHNNVWYSERGHHGTLEELPTTPASFVFTAKDGTRYSYTSALGDMPVHRIEDRNGNAMSFVYNGQQLSQVTDAAGRKCDFSYDSPANITISGDRVRLVAVSCSDAVEILFDYHPNGHLKSAKRGDRLETYDYAQESGIAGGEYNLVKATDANNHSFAYEYHTLTSLPFASWNAAKSIKPLRPQDVVKSVTYPDSAQASFAYSTTTANQRTVTDLRGNNTTYTLNYFGNPLKIEEPLGKTTLMTWSIDESKPDNVMTSKTDPLGNATIYEYDPQGNIIKETDPYGRFITTVWNQKFSLPESRTDRNNVIQGWQYDSRGNLLSETDGDGKQSSHTYYPTGERLTSKDPLGNTTNFTYDNWGNPASAKGAEGSLTKYEYDIRGRRIALIDPNGNRTEYAYDALDQPTTTTFPQHGSYALANGSGRIKAQVHDAVGNLISETDRLGLTLSYGYTPRNQVKNISRSSGGTKTFDYDNNGNLISETDWKGIASSHTYDALNRRDSSANRLGYARLMKYDLNGNLTEEQDAEGRVTNHEYDKLNRLTKTIQPALPLQVRGELAFSYYDEADPKTNLKTESDQEGNVTGYEYNGRYLRSKRTNALNYIHLWEYDDAGNLSKETDEEGHSVRHEYDRQNRLIADVRSHNGTDIKTGYGYDAAGNRTSVTDPLGRITSTGYDEWNRAWRTVDADNYIVTTELDGEGNKVKTIDANNVTRGWTRDQRGLVLTSIDGEGFETRYTYDLNGNNETVTYANTSVTSIAYDAEDRKTITTEAQGQSEERSSGVVLYNKVGNPLQVKDGNGNITTTDYNALNLPVKIIDAKGNSSTSDYYKTGKIKTATNRRVATTTTEYDKLWRVTKVTDPLNQTVESTYDKVGNVTQSKDKRGITSEIIYDDLYRPVEKKRDNLRLAGMEYDNADNLAADIDANGNRTEYAYTRRNQKEKVTFADTTSRSMTYDGNGNLKTETDEEGIVTSHGYDRENRPTAVERAGELTQKSYNEMGSLAAEIRPEGNSRTFNYNKLKRMISVIDDPWGPSLTTRYEYDKNGNLTRTTGPRGNVVENTYDELNRKTGHTQKKAAGDLQSQYEYDEEGNLAKLTDAKLQVSTYVYDLLNRKTENHYGGLDITSSYDANNNLISTTVAGTSSDSTTNTYDNFDRLKTSTQRGTAVSYTYDNNGNRLSVGTPTSTTEYSYDARNRVKTASVGSATTNFDYYADGKKKTVSYPNGAKEEYEYYPTNRVKTLTNSLNSAVISKFDYSYDRNGNRLNQDETRGSRSISTGYTYDSLDRMASYSVTENSATTRTDYNFDGYNRKTETTTKPDSSNITRTYSYDETDWLIQLQDGSKTITYSYDNNGNTIKKADSAAPGNDIVFEYDARDKLTRTSKGATVLGTYAYNANGYRIRQLGSDRGDVDYYYDVTSVIEERNSAGLLAHYRYANKLYSLFDGTQNQYYHLDALGSTTDLADDTGATKASYFLNPWGMIVDSIGNSVNRRIFTGKEIDQNTGLVYFGARYYDPDTARFTTQDTYLGEQNTPSSLHRYLYAYSNPTVFIDLEGYESIFSGWSESLNKVSDKFKQQIANLNKNEDISFIDRIKMVGITGSKTVVDLTVSVTDLADLSTDVSLAMNPATKGTEKGDKARQKLKDTANNVKLTAKKGYEYVRSTVEDPAARECAKQSLMDFGHKVFIEGDLEAGSNFIGKAFDVLLFAAPIKAAQMGKAAALEKAAISERVIANSLESGITNSTSGFAEASQRWTGGLANLAGGGFVSKSTTVLGENMMEWVIPFAERTESRVLSFGTTPDNWAKMTPKQRWKLNDGTLRSHIRDGDSFNYIGRDPYRDPALRRQFDLTGSELLRLEERGVPYEVIPRNEVQRILGRP